MPKKIQQQYEVSFWVVGYVVLDVNAPSLEAATEIAEHSGEMEVRFFAGTRHFVSGTDALSRQGEDFKIRVELEVPASYTVEAATGQEAVEKARALLVKYWEREAKRSPVVTDLDDKDMLVLNEVRKVS